MLAKHRTQIAQLAVILFVAWVVCFWRLSDFPFRPSDESLHVKATQAMLQTGEFWQLRVDGEPYFNKPPFKMWLSLIPVSLFGESAFSYRFLDALAGLLTAVVVYYGGFLFFASWSAGFWGALALLGCRYYIIFHGARSAVQDSMLVLLISLAMISGWHFLSATNRSSLRWGALTGVLVGLAMLTKSVAGLLPLILLAAFVVASGQSMSLIRKGKTATLLMVVCALLLPAAYFLPHIFFTPGAWEAMFGREVYGRFAEGMHNSNASWFYLTGLSHYRAAVPPELLSLGLMLMLWRYFKSRARPLLYVVVWAVLPLLLYGNLASRMPWYIAPSFPALALIVGYLIAELQGFALTGAAASSRLSKMSRRLCYFAGVSLVFYHLAVVLLQLVAPPREPFSMQRNFFEEPSTEWRAGLRSLVSQQSMPLLKMDLLVRQIRLWEKQHQKQASIVAYRLPKLAQHESIYFDFLAARVRRVEVLPLDLKSQDFVVAPLDRLEEVRTLYSAESYAVLPPENRMSRFDWHRRSAPLLVLAASEMPNDGSFRRVRRVQVGSDFEPLFGFEEVRRTKNSTYRFSQGARAALILPGDRVLSKLPVELELRLANQLSEPLTAKLFLNEVALGDCSLKNRDLQSCKLRIEPEVWTIDKNVLHFRFESVKPLDFRKRAVLLDRLQLSIIGLAGREESKQGPTSGD